MEKICSIFLHSFLPNSKFKNRCVADAKAPLMKENTHLTQHDLYTMTQSWSKPFGSRGEACFSLFAYCLMIDSTFHVSTQPRPPS